jgi:hypothetical protein
MSCHCVWETLSTILRCSNRDISALNTQYHEKGADKYSSAFYKAVSEFPSLGSFRPSSVRSNLVSALLMLHTRKLLLLCNCELVRCILCSVRRAHVRRFSHCTLLFLCTVSFACNRPFAFASVPQHVHSSASDASASKLLTCSRRGGSLSSPTTASSDARSLQKLVPFMPNGDASCAGKQLLNSTSICWTK